MVSRRPQVGYRKNTKGVLSRCSALTLYVTRGNFSRISGEPARGVAKDGAWWPGIALCLFVTFPSMTRTRAGAATSGEGEPAWTNLLPELLLALLGCSGGAFVYESIKDYDSESQPDDLSPSLEALLNKRLVLSQVVDWVSDAEREQLNRIVKLGWYYEWLYGYSIELTSVVSSVGVRRGRTPTIGEAKRSIRHSPYQVAVAQGCLELLDVYRQAVLRIEARLVDDKADAKETLWSLLLLEQALSEFAELFPFLFENIWGRISGEHGCASREIFEIFETAARSGIPVIEGCSLRIAWHCYQVLFKQIHAWMVHGRLVDPTGEFFIRMEVGGLGREQCVRDNLRYISADVIESRLPGAITLPFAKDVLYVGQCTRILDSMSHADRKHSATDGEGAVHDGCAEFEEALKLIWTSAPEELDWIALKNIVNARKVVLSDRVWEEVHRTDRQGNLSGHVDDFMDVVLQNRGSLYAELVDSVASISNEEPDPERAAALAAQLFREATYCDDTAGVQDVAHNASYLGMRSSINAESASMGTEWAGGPASIPQIVTMTWYDTRDTIHGIPPIWHPKYDHDIFIPSYDQWDGLCIRYDMRWPMQLVFPVKAMRVYGALWQLMFRLSRALHDMNGIRSTMKRRRYPRAVIGLHHRLHHFLSTYAMYLQEEIVARSKDEIHAILTSSASLIDAEAKHLQFVNHIVQISCIDTKQVMGVLENMFVCVKSLAAIVSAFSESFEGDDKEARKATSMVSAPETDSVCELFLSKYNVWYQLLQSGPLQVGRRGEALRRLLLKMNYNGFMDRNAARQVDQHVIHLAD